MGWAKVFRWRTFYFKIYKWSRWRIQGARITLSINALFVITSIRKKLWTITTENTQQPKKQFTPVSLSLAVAVITIIPKAIPRIYRSIEFEENNPSSKWPENLNVVDKTIIVIGSGATAVTIVPELAAEAKMVTMLQRSPTYIAALRIKIKLPLK
jgi:cation diffusion facilitator CzcD-associated flavoprotein CzcO